MHERSSVVEIALDRGKINGRAASGDLALLSQPLCEVELELIEGTSPDALFDLAIELAAEVHLHPEIVSKAERGYSLADSAIALPVKGFVSPVSKSMSPVEAFRAIALPCVLQFQRNEAGAVAGKNPDFLHQARVGIRRLRSAFKLFSPVLSVSFIEIYAPRWKALATALGRARDWDVFLSETLAPLDEAFPGDVDLAALRAKSEALQAKSQKSAVTALTRQEYSQLLLAFSAALFREAWPTIARPDKLSTANLSRFAEQRLRKRTAKIVKQLDDHGAMSAERQHELRIEFKKLRYALEFFAPILAPHRLMDYQAALATVQVILGALNDQVTAAHLIKEMHTKGQADSLIHGWIAGRTQLLQSSLNQALRVFMGRKTSWN